MDAQSEKTAGCYDRVLTVASLFSGDFSADWLADLIGIQPTLILEALSAAVQEGVIVRKGSDFYAFDNIKAQSGYRSLVPDHKKTSLHKAIVNILMRDLPEGETKTRALSYPLLEINGGVEESELLLAAGDSFLKIFNMDMARHCYGRILSNLADKTSAAEDNLFVTAALKFSKSSTAGGTTSEVLEILKNAMSRATRLNNAHFTSHLEMHLAKTMWLRSQYGQALEHFKKGFGIAEELDDPKLLRSATNFRIVSLFWHGRFREVIETYEALVPEIERFPHGGFPLLAGLTVGRCYVHIGQVSHGLGMLDAIHAFCRDKGDKYLACHSEFTIGATMMDIRRLGQAVKTLQRSVTAAQKEHNDWVLILGNLMLAYTHYLAGHKQPAMRALRDFMEHRKRVQVWVQPYPYVLELCMAIRQGHLPQVPDLFLDEELNHMVRGNNVFIKGIAYRFKAILKRLDNQPPKDILSTLEKSRGLLSESGHCIGLARTKIEFARQYLLMNNRDKAVEITREISEIVNNFSPSLLPDDLAPLLEPQVSDQKNLFKEICILGQNLGTLRDNQVLVQRIISSANGITGAERGAIFRLEKNQGRQQPELIASRNLTPEQIARPGFDKSRKMIQKVALSGQGLIQQSGRPRDSGKADGETINSSICVPMILRNEVVGVLYMDNRILKTSFKKDDLELLSFFAGQAALALDNANAYQRIKRLNLRLKKETEYYQEENCKELNFDEIVGNSQAIREVMRQARLVASTDTTVLIVGETGVGKELIARAIKQQSSRREKPFIKVNTSALAEHLVPSELFGHEKGAFTGASQRKVGRFELANEGTLFLDEISEISLDVQVSLLRVLQTKEFERVGGDATITSDFRLIAATNRDLLEEVAKRNLPLGSFFPLERVSHHRAAPKGAPQRYRNADQPFPQDTFSQGGQGLS